MTEAVALKKDEPPTQVVAPPSESAALLIMIERAARDSTIDIDRMERLVAIHRDMEMRQSEKRYNAAMADAQAEMVPIVKNQSNTHTRSRYADLAAIAEVAFPIIGKHGFGQSFSTLASDVKGYMRVVCEVTHRDGFSKRYEWDVPLDVAGSQGKVNKTEIQAMGSTMTYARRYFTCMIFNIAIKDDTDGNKQVDVGGPITEAQVDIINARFDAHPIHDRAQFCAFFKIDDIADLPAKDFKRAMHAMGEREKNAAGGGDV